MPISKVSSFPPPQKKRVYCIRFSKSHTTNNKKSKTVTSNFDRPPSIVFKNNNDKPSKNVILKKF